MFSYGDFEADKVDCHLTPKLFAAGAGCVQHLKTLLGKRVLTLRCKIFVRYRTSLCSSAKVVSMYSSTSVYNIIVPIRDDPHAVSCSHMFKTTITNNVGEPCLTPWLRFLTAVFQPYSSKRACMWTMTIDNAPKTATVLSRGVTSEELVKPLLRI